MKKKSWKKELKKVIQKKDSRFWLMVFVVCATLGTLVLWSINLNKVFSVDTNKQDGGSSVVSSAQDDLSDVFEDFILLLDKIETDKASSSDELELNEFSPENIDKMKEMVNEKINEKDSNEEGLASSTASNQPIIPVISPDYDQSDLEIRELQRKINDLENKLNNLE